MAFTFLVENGTGLSGATSYVSVSDANDIIAVNIHANISWDALADDDKEKFLSWASRYLDTQTRWFGYKKVQTSALRWPRSGVVDRDGFLLSDTTITSQLKIATAEMARYMISEDRTTERDQDALKRIKADVIEIEFSEGYRLPAVPSHLQYLLNGLGAIASGNIRFVRIIR